MKLLAHDLTIVYKTSATHKIPGTLSRIYEDLASEEFNAVENSKVRNNKVCTQHVSRVLEELINPR